MANHPQQPFPPQPVPPPASSVPQQPLAAATVQSPAVNSDVPKVKDQPRCDLCEIQVSSEVVLQTHLAGKSHQKKLRHAETQAKIANVDAASSSHSGFTKLSAGTTTALPGSSNSLVCDVCKITTNSPQQMDLHLTGSKHKKVVASKTKRMGAANLSPTLGSPLLTSPADLPPSIILVKDAKTGAPAGGYKCKSCDCVLNSDEQLREHIATERHQNMEIGIPCDLPKSREERKFHPYSGPAKFAQKASNSANATSWKARQMPYDTQNMQPLRHFFKKGQGML